MGWKAKVAGLAVDATLADLGQDVSRETRIRVAMLPMILAPTWALSPRDHAPSIQNSERTL